MINPGCQMDNPVIEAQLLDAQSVESVEPEQYIAPARKATSRVGLREGTSLSRPDAGKSAARPLGEEDARLHASVCAEVRRLAQPLVKASEKRVEDILSQYPGPAAIDSPEYNRAVQVAALMRCRSRLTRVCAVVEGGNRQVRW